MKIVIYSCISGGYDKSLPSLNRDHKFEDCVLFTDGMHTQSSTWRVCSLRSPESLVRGDLINRYHKFFAESFFPEAAISIYVDGNIDILQDISPLVNDFAQSGAVFACLKHPQRSTVLAEVDTCKRLGKFKSGDELRVDNQLSTYQKEGFPLDFPLFAAGVLFRKHGVSSELSESMLMWWLQVNRYTCRDQLSLPFVLWKSKLPFMAFDLDIFDNPYFLRRSHGVQSGVVNRVKRRFRNVYKRYISN